MKNQIIDIVILFNIRIIVSVIISFGDLTIIAIPKIV